MGPIELHEEVTRRSESLGRPIIVGVSGYGGSGKSTLTRRLAAFAPGIVRMRGDDFLDPRKSHLRSNDWDGVERHRLADEVLVPFQERRRSEFRRFDWSRRALGDPEPVPTGDVLIVDLIGLLHPSMNDVLDLTVWCDVPLLIAQERGIARDARLGRDHRRLWHEVWTPNEIDFDANFAPRERADFLMSKRSLESLMRSAI